MEKRERRVDLDDILKQELGQFGLFQLRTLLLALLIVLFMSWSANEYVFTTARINTRCLVPECDESSPEFSPPWILNTAPSATGCERYPSLSSVNVTTDATCPANMFDANTLVECEQRVYENTLSVVYDLDLGCEEWRRSLIGSIRTFGTLTALPITGYISDGWGRRAALVFNAVNTAWLGALRYVAGSYAGFVISEFAESTFGSGGFSCAYIIVTEAVGPKYRVATGATMNTFFSVGQITMGLIAWAVPAWRSLTLALYLPQLVCFAYLWLISESVRWYLSKGRYDDAEKVLKNIAKVNKKQLSEKSLEALRATAEKEKQAAATQHETKEPWLVVQVFRNKKILLRCCISPIWWITNLFIYYGMSINSVNMSGNRYLNYMAVSAAQIPGYWASMLLLDRLGRRPVLIMAFWIGATCQFTYIFMPEDLPGASLAVYLVGTFASAMTMTAVYVYTLELYPTRYRHSLFAFSSMMGRVGSILAPLTPALGAAVWDKLPFALFGALALLSGALIFLTPETLGAALPDTLQQAADLGNKKKTTEI